MCRQPEDVFGKKSNINYKGLHSRILYLNKFIL